MMCELENDRFMMKYIGLAFCRYCLLPSMRCKDELWVVHIDKISLMVLGVLLAKVTINSQPLWP